jgi:glycosyltransferase involved in cell wall biosynthesis
VALNLIYLAPLTAGHHIGHIKLFIERAVSDPRVQSLHFAVGGDFMDRAGADPCTLADNSPKISFEIVSPQTTGFRDGWFIWKEARRLVESRPGSVCFISEFDRPLPGAVFDRRPMPGFVTGIILSPRMRLTRQRTFTSLRRGLMKKASFMLAKNKNVPLLFTLDRYYFEKLPRLISRNWRLIPDPLAMSQEDHADLLASPGSSHADRLRFLLFGSLGRRKGLFTLLEALECLSVEERRRIEVTIAGLLTELTPGERERWPARVARAAALEGVNLRVIEQFLTDSELVALVKNSDVVLAPYIDHFGPSNLLLWATAAGRPVVAPSVGWMGQVVKTERLGFTCDTTSPSDLARTMSLATQPGALDQFPSERLRRFYDGNSPDEFYDGIISAIEERAVELNIDSESESGERFGT